MPVNSYTYDLDNIGVTTLQILRPRIADAIFKASPTIAFLLANGRVRRENGGKWIEEPLMYSKNTTVKAYRGYDVLDVSPTEELTSARFQWRQAAGSITISGLEELQNAGEASVFNLLKQKIKVLEMSFREWMNEKIHAATATKDVARDILGLSEIIENQAGASQGTLGGIDKGTYDFWRNQRSQPAYAGAPYAYTARPLTKEMEKFFNECSKGLARPNLILTTQAMYEHYKFENHDLLRLNTAKDTGMLDVGFESEKFRGVTILWDENAAANLMYFLNTEYMGFVIHSRRNFVMTPFASPHNQDARTAQMLFAGNMTASNCRFLGVLDNLNLSYS
jgi:hypothetical protein